MVKILSKSGDSLADTYDVVGSVAGIEQLESREVTLVHEMGGTIFSERLSGEILRVSSGAISQSTNWGLPFADLGASPIRILGLAIVADTASRVSIASLAVRSLDQQNEVPIFVWDTINDGVSTVRLIEGGVLANKGFLLGNPVDIPNFMVGLDQPQGMDELVFRGITTAFGAGTVEVVALVYKAFATISGISSKGLPIPSW